MGNVNVDLERGQLQQRVKSWMIHDLGYQFLGNLEDQENKGVKEELLRANLKKRGYQKEQIDLAVKELMDLYSNQSENLYTINKKIYSLIRYGRQGAKDEQKNRKTVHYIDWKNIEANDFQLAEEVRTLKFDGQSHHRPDLVIYVNGIALVVFELKRSSTSISQGIRQSLSSQKRENIQEFYHPVQLIFAGNESEGMKYGTTGTPEKYYLTWKEDEKATDAVSLEVKKMQTQTSNRLKNGIVSLCHKKRFLSFIHDFVIFDAGIKKVARHNQFFANMAARTRIKANEGGIIWNTQGSGKSLIMVWLTKWIIENIDESRVVIITDRDELDDQIESLFFDVDEKVRRAKSSADLRDILDKNEDSIICSLIHKYGHNGGGQSDVDGYVKELKANLPANFKAKGNIIAFIDECHRTNSGKLHEAVKTIMPDALLIGFTGTPLLKKDKQTSVETFGSYIHTYKFNEGVEDGVVLDLRYEAKDVDQNLRNKDRVDNWFDIKTKDLTERAKIKLKQSWTSINKLYSSKQRLEKIAGDIIYDMSTKPRLKDGRGTAMLVAGSIFEACKYWEIFTNNGFTQCAVVTSYEPTDASVRTATSDPNQESEDEYKKSIYERMLNGKSVSEFEAEVKEKFKKEPGQMKLLIVVDKLLTGFDAPSATYIYIDKSMRDHDLFQAICRVNRPDGEGKDYGYIVDYMDLFRNVQSAMFDYTSEAFDNYDKEDIEGLLKSRFDEAKAEMVGAIAALGDLFDNIDGNEDTDYIDYFCGDDSESDDKGCLRDTLYSLTASLTRSFADCSGKLESDYGYSEEEVSEIRNQILGYNNVKDLIRLASCDYIDLKAYEPDMRFILDTYIRAEDSKTINNLDDMSLVELLIDSTTTTPVDLVNNIPGSDEAKAEIITNNVKHEIVKKAAFNPKFYGKLSEMLEEIIEQRRIEAISYEEYLKRVVELAKLVLHPENSGGYPDLVKDSEAKRALFDYFDGDTAKAVNMHNAIKVSLKTNWKENQQKKNSLKLAIFNNLSLYSSDEDENSRKVEEIFEIVERQEEYDM
ncbi:type I restriction endonuclease subunit R [Gemella haemolysans]|uniref:type I restriction endonuclease subunit R n=1 Tax=Gemella haemolysans TaxID=1379 RepID=UPI00195E0D28|nr:HsdR family type I site-specific deoxyribonuclease [Gemella haemolysans]VTX81470.1 Type-1 restriction enzyme R protein [Gemella haemolysans]